jgi:hypothetical protein
MMMREREKLILGVMLLVIVMFLVIIVTLPLRIDELLLLNDDVCSVPYRERSEKWTEMGFKTVVDRILWKILVRLRDNHDVVIPKQSETSSSGFSIDFEEQHPFQSDGTSCGIPKLHPICHGYREFRSTAVIQTICIPLNWFYSCRFQLRNISIHSSTSYTIADLMPQLKYQWESPSSYCLHSTHSIDPSIKPPAIFVNSIDVNFQSWTKPVIAVNGDGIKFNFVLQKGRRPIYEHNDNTFRQIEDNRLSFLIGDMTIQEAIGMLPSPPEQEGLYPKIGLINMTNLSINVLDNSSKKQSHILTKLNVPDAFFAPLVNLTSSEYNF